jgi:hypothetical protein
MDLSQIDAEHAVQCGPDIEGRCVDLLGLYTWLGQLSDRFCPFVAQRRDQDFELAVAVQHLRLVDIVEFQRLGQGKDMLIPVVAHQRRADRLGG